MKSFQKGMQKATKNVFQLINSIFLTNRMKLLNFPNQFKMLHIYNASIYGFLIIIICQNTSGKESLLRAVSICIKTALISGSVGGVGEWSHTCMLKTVFYTP